MKTAVGTQNKGLDVCASASRRVSNTAYFVSKTLQCKCGVDKCNPQYAYECMTWDIIMQMR